MRSTKVQKTMLKMPMDVQSWRPLTKNWLCMLPIALQSAVCLYLDRLDHTHLIACSIGLRATAMLSASLWTLPLATKGTRTGDITLRGTLQRHLLTPLTCLVIEYAHTRDADLVVSWQSDDYVYALWLCGPCGQDTLAGWRLPIHFDVDYGYPMILKAIDLVGLPGVTIVCWGRATPETERCIWMLRLPPVESDGTEDGDSEGPRGNRQIVATKLPPDSTFWGSV
jgi:hypothetical protein